MLMFGGTGIGIAIPCHADPLPRTDTLASYLWTGHTHERGAGL